MVSMHIKRFITGSVIGTIFWMLFFYCSTIVFSTALVMILGTIVVKEWTVIFKQNRYYFWLLMPIYPVLPFVLLIYMNHNSEYRVLLYYLFLIVFSFDTAAYIVGSIIGSRKIIPRFSPGKTVEGCFGGFLGALVVFYWSLWQSGTYVSNAMIIALTVAICTVAFLGDIFESMLKRQASLKHSGTILPGHGGFLDRFDAVMMVTFLFFIFRNPLAKLLLQG